ncbi:prostate and testis expressed protein 2-like [Cynocephalus volans]|uniref:prostate and testis expressed protein 2-like n=1 Tax=Cynocephalus volans TaxID=110931 RepID=UPI002FC5F696
MDKFLLLLLLLGVFPLVIFRAQATVCMVCNLFKRGYCLTGKGNCTMKQGPGCRTRNFFIFTERDGWLYNHTELDCSHYCTATHMYYLSLKISTYCCKGQDFCNRDQGKIVK